MARHQALIQFIVSCPSAFEYEPEHAPGERAGYVMIFRTLELRRRLLVEADDREVHADELAELAVRAPTAIHEPTLRVLAHSQRIRAMELRGQAAALALEHGYRAGSDTRST